MAITMKDVKEVRVKHPLKKKRYYVSRKSVVYYKNAGGELVEMKPFKTKDGYVEYVLTRTNGTKQHIQAQIIGLSTYKGLPRDKAKTQVNQIIWNG